MARTTQWDDEFLQQRASATEEAAFAELRAHDWRRAELQHRREVSDTVHGFSKCPDSRCRRARHCLEQAHLACDGRLRVDVPEDVRRSLIEEIYAELQEERRDAAVEEEAEE